MSAPAFELSTEDIKLPYAVEEPHVPGHAQDPAAAVAADGGVLIPPAAGADARPQYISGPALEAGRKVLAVTAGALAGFVPGIGEGKNLAEAWTGRDVVTGEELALWQRGVKLIAAVPSEANVVKAADNLDKLLDGISIVEALIDVDREMERTESLSGEDPPPDPKAGPMHYPPHGTP